MNGIFHNRLKTFFLYNKENIYPGVPLISFRVAMYALRYRSFLRFAPELLSRCSQRSRKKNTKPIIISPR